VTEISRNEDWELETDRLLLSPTCTTDAEPLYGLLKEPALYSFMTNPPPSGVRALEERIRLWERRRSPAGDEVWLNWTVRRKHRATVVGHIQATVQGSRAEIAWVIGLPFQGQGYATEASRRVGSWLTERFKIEELRANIHPRHLASQAVARHIGLRPGSETTAEGEECWVRGLR
jgi:RimJ/RimL family protein N-acetyltransferase